MLRIRIASIGALAAISLMAFATGGGAQTTAQPGQPLALLAGLNPPHAKAHAAKAHATHGATAHVARQRAAKEHVAKTRFAKDHVAKTDGAKDHDKTAHGKIARARTHHGRSAKIAAAPVTRQSTTVATTEGKTNSETNSPPLTSAPDNNKQPAPPDNAPAIADVAPPAANAAAAAPTTDNPDMSAIVVNGQTVPISPSDEINDIDRAAAAKSAAEHAADAVTAPANNVAAAPDSDSAKSGDDAQPAKTRFAAAALSDDGQSVSQSGGHSKVGSASWIAQVLAALGGAVAAGAVAWFLIGTGPVRTYS